MRQNPPTNNVSFSGRFLITSANPYPEASFRLADYLLSFEGTSNAVFGLQGKGWDYVKPEDDLLGLDGSAAIFNQLNAEFNNSANNLYGYQTAPLNRPIEYRRGQMVIHSLELNKMTKPQSDLIAARTERTGWFLANRFGMFIHWGLYAIPARGEWIRSFENISNEDYQRYFDEFNPSHYHPKEWARTAKQAGMKYAVLTAKHHDGFCLFDSKLTDYKSTNTQARRDLVDDYVKAFRAEGLKVGLYYSLLDWHHPHYPAYGDKYHPMRANEDYKEQVRDFSLYLDYFHGQVTELLTNYGRIDIMWFDFSYGDLRGEGWRATELMQKVRALQPDILIDNRLGASGEGNHHFGSQSPEIFSGDFACPEQMIPPGGLVDPNNQPVPWEACITLNNHWGYCATDQDYKSAKQVVRALVECVSKSGNLLLNVGPDTTGRIPSDCECILSEVGDWMRLNSDSIYGCGRSDLPKPEWGRYTLKGNTLYAHIFERGIGPINFVGLSGKIKKIRLLADGSEIRLETSWMTADYAEDAFVNFPTSRLPDEIDTVVEIELI